MINSIKQKAIVGKNGKIELSETELTEGSLVEVLNVRKNPSKNLFKVIK